MKPIIQVVDLEKIYKGTERGKGLEEAFKALFAPKYVYSKAVKKISFSIEKGEIVGFVGPNGAGKSTTIKMMTGVLYPTSGDVHVMGYMPWQDRKKYVKHIGAVFGQKSQLWWDLPPVDSFYLARGIYNIPEKEFEERLHTMVDLLKISKVMHRPTRELSLGERMKCEFIMALLHNPPVLFLDEPTIGVDALAKEEIREFLLRINRKYKTTIILTTHDMDDIEELCERMIVIDRGTIIYDGDLQKVKQKYVIWQTVDFEYTEIKNKRKFAAIMKKGIVQINKKWFKSIRFNKKEVNVPKVIEQLMCISEIVDLAVHEPRLEHVIKEIYQDPELKK